MKRLNIYLFAAITLFCLSCEDDMPQSFDFQESSQVTVAPGNSTFFDLTNPTTTSVDLELDILGEREVESIIITKSYNNSPIIDHSTVSGSTSSINIALTSAVEGFGITTDDLELGDSFRFGFRAVLTSGVEVTSKNVYVANLSCPSNIPEGMWTGENTDVATFGTTSTNTEVVIASLGAGAYSVSDVSGGAYFACCSGVGFVRDQPVTILDVCNSISVTGSVGSQVSIGDDLENQGSWDPVTGILTINWCDNSNGFCSTTTFTKN